MTRERQLRAAHSARPRALARSMLPPASMLLTPKHLPRLAAIVGLFTRYGLRDIAK